MSSKLAVCLAGLTCAGLFPPLLAGEHAHHLLTSVRSAESQRDSTVAGLVSTRRYVLRNNRWTSDAVMHVRMTSQPGVPKQFEILEMENAEGLRKKVFMKLLQGEVEASRSGDSESEITAANYDFVLLGRENVKGRDCIVLQLIPKRKSKVLIEGKAWVDPEESAIIRIEGRTARNISFWIGKAQIEHDFRKVDDIWLLAHNRSVSKVKLFGDTELTIDFLKYDMTRTGSFASARRLPAK